MSFRTKNTYTIKKNITWFSTSTSLYYIPLTGTTGESTDPDNIGVIFAPTGPGRLSRIDLYISNTGSSTIIALHDDSGEIGNVTKTLLSADALNIIDFDTELTSGTNRFDGTERLRIALTPVSGIDTGLAIITFEMDIQV